jgi:hypothetical protein
MISNPAQRDGTDGTAASASPESYLARRQGNLIRASDGFRAPTLPTEPRRRAEGGHRPDASLSPYTGTPRAVGDNDPRNTPRTWAYFRQASPGAPRVNYPDRTRTAGKLQQSGEAWGRFGEPARAVLTPARDGSDAPPSHTLGDFRPGSASAYGPRWHRPETPHIYDHLPH